MMAMMIDTNVCLLLNVKSRGFRGKLYCFSDKPMRDHLKINNCYKIIVSTEKRFMKTRLDLKEIISEKKIDKKKITKIYNLFFFFFL